MKRSRIFALGFAAAFMLAIFIRFYRLGFCSLWMDEAIVGFTLIKPTIKEMIFPAGMTQPAPIFFLATLRSIISIFGKSEFALRLLPAVAGTLSIILTYLLCKKITLGDKAASTIAALLLAFNPMMVRYSREMKNYIVDVFFLLLLFYVTEIFISKRYDKKYFALLLLISVISVGFSYVAVFAILTVSIRLLFEVLKLKEWKKLTGVAIYLCAGTAIFLSAYLLILLPQMKVRGYGSGEWAQQYFMQSHAPYYIFSFICKHTYEFFTYLFNATWYPFGHLINIPLLMCLLFLLGIVSVSVKRNYAALIYCSFPMALAIAASAFKKFTYGGWRADLFLAPLIFIYIALALSRLLKAQGRLGKSLLLLFLCALLTLPYVSTPPPWLRYPDADIENIKPVLKFYGENKLPKDLTYVYYGARPAFVFYRGETDKNITYGKDYRENPLKFYAELNNMIKDGGADRVWVILSHYPVEYKKLFLRYFLMKGYELSESSADTNVRVYMFKSKGALI